MITKYQGDQVFCKLATIGHLAAHSIIERYKSINNQGNRVHRVSNNELANNITYIYSYN